MPVITWPASFVPQTIVQKPLEAIGRRREEKPCYSTPLPGSLVSVNSSDQWIVHPTAGGYAEMWVLMEDSLQGGTISTAYVANNPGFAAALVAGDQFLGLIAAAANVNPSSLLQSNGDGTFTNVSGSNVPLVRAVQTINNTSGGAVSCILEVI